METLTVTILEPKARKLLEDLANLDLIKVQETKKPKRKPRKFGSMKGLVVRKAGSAKGKYELAPDFDAPLEDFKEYV
jgi:hypothetical protein